MATLINQKPLYDTLPVGQQIIFTVFNLSAVQNNFNVKYVAEVHVDNSAIDIDAGGHLVATFKTTPNNAGVGIFDLRSLLESYVSSDNLGSSIGDGSQYKGVTYSLATPHPIHLIDKFARSNNSMRYFRVKFTVEGSSTATAPVAQIANSAVYSINYLFFNGVLQRNDYLTLTGSDYGYNLAQNLLYTANSDSAAKFLSNAPTTQYANINDYGAIGFLNFLPESSDKINYITLRYYDSTGGSLGSETVNQLNANGGASGAGSISNNRLLYFGGFPGNLQNTATTFKSLVTAGTIQGGYYTIQANSTSSGSQQLYTINLNCPNTKGFESVRLCWLNQWGVWDYYTFTMKSVRTTSTNRTTYTQMSGSWNESRYSIDGFKGGKKNFRVNSTEKIRVNTDFVTEADAVWFEELVNSQQVYIINGYDSAETPPYNTMTNKYVEPVLITTSSYTRKTIANDKLIQYTFEMDRNKTQQTQTS